ncbi:MAG: DUF3857 domain-containing protein [Acidobacteria bacterium]|nr:DUF3857 domain-containing protein [Acidobacteriota bacterium]MCI0568860.1 DUF3857 domain-containing protein [Acidobacteriota bacterium]
MTSLRLSLLISSRNASLSPKLFVALLVVLACLTTLTASPKKGQESASSGGWPEITAEERSLSSLPQDPGAAAVLLRNDRTGKIRKIADDTVNFLQYHWRLKVLKPAGKEFADVHLPAGKYSRVSNIQARTVKADGSVVAVAPDQIFQKVVRQVGDFKFIEWVFSFPAVEPGVILEYQYERRVDNLLSITPWYFEGGVFTVRSRVEQSVPKGMGYSILCDYCQGVKPEISPFREGKTEGQTYAVELKNLPGYREEIFMPPPREVSPRLEMVLQIWKGHILGGLGRQDSIFTDWAAIAKYVNANYQAGVKGGLEELKTLATTWTEGAADPTAKIQAVFRHVQRDFRYLPYDDVYGLVRPLQEILKSGYADNEEKAVLLQAALKVTGIDSDIALVSGKDAGTLNPKFASLTQFTHDVVVIPQSAGPLMVLDPTVAYAPFGFMPWQDSGAGALFLKGGLGEVGTLPVKNELSTTKYQIAVSPRADAKADLEIEARYTGEDAIDNRENLAPYSESARAETLKGWLERALPGAVLVSQSFENLENVQEPLVLKVKAEAPGLVTLAEGAATVRGCVLFCYDANPFAATQREHPIFVDRGWNKEQIVDIHPPAGMTPGEPPLGLSARSAIGNFTMRYSAGDANSVKCTGHMVASRGRWAASEMDGVRAMYEKVVQADRTAVAFQAGTPSGS